MSSAIENKTSGPAQVPVKSGYHRKRPFWARLTGHERLTKAGSAKDTRHLVLELKDSGLTYTPGDSLGAFGLNPPSLVEDIIGLLGFDPETPLVDADGDIGTLRSTLLRDYTLNRANRKILAGLAERIPQGEQRNRLMELLDNSDLLAEYIDTRDYVDVLREFDQAKFDSVEAFMSQLSPAAPRLYSIASSLATHAGEAHLCVTVVRYESHGRPKRIRHGRNTQEFTLNSPLVCAPTRNKHFAGASGLVHNEKRNLSGHNPGRAWRRPNRRRAAGCLVQREHRSFHNMGARQPPQRSKPVRNQTDRNAPRTYFGVAFGQEMGTPSSPSRF